MTRFVLFGINVLYSIHQKYDMHITKCPFMEKRGAELIQNSDIIFDFESFIFLCGIGNPCLNKVSTKAI